MEVRACQMADVERVAELNAMVQQLHYEAHPEWFPEPDSSAVVDWLRTLLGEAGGAGGGVDVFVADDGEAILGYVLARVLDRPATPFTRYMRLVELDQIGVDPASRRAGVGSALVRRVMELADGVGADRVILTTWSFNVGAQRFFAARGLVTLSVRMGEPVDDRSPMRIKAPRDRLDGGERG